jgi:hypothetical protein
MSCSAAGNRFIRSSPHSVGEEQKAALPQTNHLRDFVSSCGKKFFFPPRQIA